MIVMMLCFCMTVFVQFPDSKPVLLVPGSECKHGCIMECAGECFHAVLVELLILFVSMFINTRLLCLCLILADCNYTRNL